MMIKILIIFAIIIAVFDYLIILGASKCKTKEDILEDDLEEIKFLNNINKSK